MDKAREELIDHMEQVHMLVIRAWPVRSTNEQLEAEHEHEKRTFGDCGWTPSEGPTAENAS